MAMLVLLSLACTQQPKKGTIMEDVSTLDDYELVGNVKSVREKSYGTGTIDGEPTNLLYNESYLGFDEDGRLISEKVDGEGAGYVSSYEYDAEGRLVKFVLASDYEAETTRVKTYDAQGRLVRSELTIATPVPVVLTDLYKYDQNNNLVEITAMSGDGGIGQYRTINLYDDKNRLIETVEDSGEGIPTKTVFAYNAADSLVSTTVYSSSGSLYEETLYSYNDKGVKVKIEHRTYDEEGNLSYTRLEHCNESGAVTLQEDYGSDQVLNYKVKNIYDAKGVLVESIHYSLSEDNAMAVDSHSKYKYDAKGNLIEEVSDFPGQGYSRILKKVYEYDSRGNWTRCELIQIYDGEELPLKNITDREITYHD